MIVRDCIVASLLAMTVHFIICTVTPKTNLTYLYSHCEPDRYCAVSAKEGVAIPNNLPPFQLTVITHQRPAGQDCRHTVAPLRHCAIAPLN